MKDLFPGYYPKSNEELESIWKDSVIFFDTNTLLNLYRYSENTRSEFIKLIGLFKDRVYLPHQVGLEYNENRITVIVELEKEYEDFKKNIEQISNTLKSSKKHPFFSSKIEEKFSEAFKEANVEVEENVLKYKNYVKKDPIYEAISSLFVGRIVEFFDTIELMDIYKEGEERYNKKIPPGYKDTDKPDFKKYGDLVLWKQILQYSKKNEKNVILVTDDNKEDWWWKSKDDKIIGPRHELIAEMKTFSGMEFHMYSSERFLDYGSKFLQKSVDKDVLTEIESVKRVDENGFIFETIMDNTFYDENELTKKLTDLDRASNNLRSLIERSENIMRRLDRIRGISTDYRASKRYHELMSNLRSLYSRIRFITRRHYILRNEYIDNKMKNIYSFIENEDEIT